MYTAVVILQVPFIQGSVKSELMCCSQNHFHAHFYEADMIHKRLHGILPQFQPIPYLVKL
jgi:hypothetical protein